MKKSVVTYFLKVEKKIYSFGRFGHNDRLDNFGRY